MMVIMITMMYVKVWGEQCDMWKKKCHVCDKVKNFYASVYISNSVSCLCVYISNSISY